MTKIIAALVKELRERTSMGIMECKKALIEANADIELAIHNMRKSGVIKAAKKAANLAEEGIIKIKIENNYAAIIELNCQTDFVAKHIHFELFANNILDEVINKKIDNINILKNHFEEERITLISKMGENITIRRVAILEGKQLNSYQHGVRIGVLISTKGADQELSKQIAMHITACKPEFINPEDVSKAVFQKEYKIQMDIAMQSNKPIEIARKMVDGRMKKFVNEISLLNQFFIIDPSKTISDLLKEKSATVISFIRFEVGESINEVDSIDLAAIPKHLS
ncbi:translation elongation factor Ts [Candidatus Pantoea carbekii]|uniref:Elongation factor Ts n=1 Tax=Candidatus Pantoea carbekii TaxID=1235990 RepID=U3U7W9_9GAMM|nr:translation elongation factor Ts [Candidatus Pantoea carbekii]AKC31903.1 translation elongation factor Ts [Candidatus Pantoea carbekii]BAO00419.1 translation elongation factor Ts [Candidatus Pantoea carbekii]